ncbi:MAG TPA: hypothetical protein VIT44_18330 [Cyclobacteriaceae bacterium]
MKSFARLTHESIYVINYEKMAFEYVSESPLFLLGYTPEEVLNMGYEFYFKNEVKCISRGSRRLTQKNYRDLRTSAPDSYRDAGKNFNEKYTLPG